MKTKKSKFIAGITALILLFGVFFMVKAMENSNKIVSTSKSAAVPYYYNGPETTNIATLKDPSNWSTTQNSAFECGGSKEVPCSIPAESPADLSTQLQPCNNLADVMSVAGNHRQED